MRLKTIATNCTVVSMIACTMFVSCQKNLDSKPAISKAAATETSALQNIASMQLLITTDGAQQADMAIHPDVFAAFLQEAKVVNCAPIITYDNPPGVYPRTVTVDWGTAGCYQPMTGLTRKGKTLTTYYGDMSVPGNYYTQTYEDYYVNSTHIEGSIKMSHNTRKNNTAIQNVYRETQLDRKTTDSLGNVIIYTGYRRYVKQSDDGQFPGPLHMGNFRVTGQVNGTEMLHDGTNYQWRDSISTDAPLIYRNCDFPGKGKQIIDFTNHSSWFVDYGMGGCDDQAQMTIDGITTTITLPFYR